ncbi:MAG TPA: lysine--tRNA ligase [Thermoanaerobaculia bacterium]|nr:lysine--tRNA ligase [Thermoanaerobaculia bacterium]
MPELEEQVRVRRQKRDAMERAGVPLYPNRFDLDMEPAEVHRLHGVRTAEELEGMALALAVPGRVTAIREHGKLAFVDLSDGREKLQLFIRRNQLPERAATVLDNLDLGDFVGASGTLMRTRLGELSLMTADLTLLAKALRPLPEKWHGLADVEARYRQRYLDLATNPESRRVFETRSRLVAGIRRFLDERGFLEVETPMMHLIPGGATARPFKTHHNALDLDLYLRVAPELFLKRLLVGGLPKVYEINRNFRNEGISTRHNPEFTMLELYQAYVDHEALMELVEEMLSTLVAEVCGGEEITWKGEAIPLARPWRRLSIRQAVVEYAGLSAEEAEDPAALAAELARRGAPLPPAATYGHLLMAVFEHAAEEHLTGPVFVTGHPVEVSPLAKQSPEDPRFTERFELYLGGMEIANAFSELNDPDVQAERFDQQVAARESGDAEAHLFDGDYIRALEHGMPPAGGCGIGIDRLTMLLTDRASIRDVILFPLLRPEPVVPDGAPPEEDTPEP